MYSLNQTRTHRPTMDIAIDMFHIGVTSDRMTDARKMDAPGELANFPSLHRSSPLSCQHQHLLTPYPSTINANNQQSSIMARTCYASTGEHLPSVKDDQSKNTKHGPVAISPSKAQQHGIAPVAMMLPASSASQIGTTRIQQAFARIAPQMGVLIPQRLSTSILLTPAATLTPTKHNADSGFNESPGTENTDHLVPPATTRKRASHVIYVKKSRPSPLLASPHPKSTTPSKSPAKRVRPSEPSDDRANKKLKQLAEMREASRDSEPQTQKRTGFSTNTLLPSSVSKASTPSVGAPSSMGQVSTKASRSSAASKAPSTARKIPLENRVQNSPPSSEALKAPSSSLALIIPSTRRNSPSPSRVQEGPSASRARKAPWAPHPSFRQAARDDTEDSAEDVVEIDAAEAVAVNRPLEEVPQYCSERPVSLFMINTNNERTHSAPIHACANRHAAPHRPGDKPHAHGVCWTCRYAAERHFVTTGLKSRCKNYWPLCQSCGDSAKAGAPKNRDGSARMVGCSCDTRWLCYGCRKHDLEMADMKSDLEAYAMRGFVGMAINEGENMNSAVNMQAESEEMKSFYRMGWKCGCGDVIGPGACVFRCAGCDGLREGTWTVQIALARSDALMRKACAWT